ncbi:MAG: hypothetical protein HY541_00495 [Deltaproteobacteria bacterium]|nr:hypothetical protein [Deltaproteobacteria bacterium]
MKKNQQVTGHWSPVTGLLSLFFGLLSLVLGLWSSPLWAGGPIIVNDEGVAAVWDTSDSDPITLHPESGSCATFSNAETIDLVESNISVWSDIAGASLSFAIDEGELGSVDEDNYNDFIVSSGSDSDLSDGINPVIFDDTGEIMVDTFGECNQFLTLGFAGPDAFTGDNFETIFGGYGIFNCLCLPGNPNGPCTITAGCADDTGADPGDVVEFSEDDLDFTMTHEVGHMLNLDHSQVNADIIPDAGCDADVAGDCDDLPLEYPIAEDSADQISPTRDDEVALLTLYGDSSLEDDFCTVTGSLTDTSGDPLRCADVQAETADTADAIAMVSGAFAPAEDTDGDGYTDGDEECLSDCGDFTLRGLDPAKTYTITVKPIDSFFDGSSRVGPCASGQLGGIDEEVIAAAVNCGAGETEALGTIATTSTGGVTEGGGGDGDDDDGTVSLGCNLAAKPLPSSSFVVGLIFLMGLFLTARWQMLRS